MRKLFVFCCVFVGLTTWRWAGEEINWHFVALKLFGCVYKSKWCIFHSRNSRRPFSTHISLQERIVEHLIERLTAAGGVLLAWKGTCAWMKCVRSVVGGEYESEVKATNVKVPEQTTENIIHIAQESHKLLLVLSLLCVSRKGREKEQRNNQDKLTTFPFSSLMTVCGEQMLLWMGVSMFHAFEQLAIIFYRWKMINTFPPRASAKLTRPTFFALYTDSHIVRRREWTWSVWGYHAIASSSSHSLAQLTSSHSTAAGLMFIYDRL